MADVKVQLTDTASLVGKVEEGASKAINAFLGVPYAAPPMAELRWQPPQPFPMWTGERQAKEFGEMN